MAWLIRDNRNLLQWVSGGACLDGTAFEDLDPDDFDSTCAVITPSPETTSTTELPTTETTTTVTPTTTESTTITPTTESSTTKVPTTEVPTTQSTSTTTTSTTLLPRSTRTSTTLLSTTTTSTTLLPTTTTSATLLPTTIQPSNNEDLQLLLLYITLGLIGVSLLILIFSCIYLIYYRQK